MRAATSGDNKGSCDNGCADADSMFHYSPLRLIATRLTQLDHANSRGCSPNGTPRYRSLGRMTEMSRPPSVPGHPVMPSERGRTASLWHSGSGSFSVPWPVACGQAVHGIQVSSLAGSVVRGGSPGARFECSRTGVPGLRSDQGQSVVLGEVSEVLDVQGWQWQSVGRAAGGDPGVVDWPGPSALGGTGGQFAQVTAMLLAPGMTGLSASQASSMLRLRGPQRHSFVH